MNDRLQKAAQKAIEKWGQQSQLDMIEEECAELALELIRRKRNRHKWENIIEECADVYIMMAEAFVIFGDEMTQKIDEKLARLEERLS
jgi:NTP pyrophosphatase (non-canonical NTP hydrolase)